MNMWKERICRARLCTLDVALASSPCSRTSYDIDIVALQMHLLTPHFAALRSIEIQFNSYAPYLWNAALGPFCQTTPHLWEYRSSCAVEVPKLESLTLRYPLNDDIKEFSLFGSFAPKLTRVTLEGVRLTWHPELFGNLSFLDYTHHGFSCGEDAVDEILSMLQISFQLRELKLCIRHKATTFQVLRLRRLLIGDDDIALPSLESLSLHVDSEDSDIPSELNAILSRLSLLKLKNLYLQDSAAVFPHLRPFPALPMLVDTICRNTSLSNLMVEGRWAEPLFVSGLRARLPLLTSFQVGNMVLPRW